VGLLLPSGFYSLLNLSGDPFRVCWQSKAFAMLPFILKRVFQSFLVLIITGAIAFSMFTFVGDPVDNMLGQERTMEDVERLRAQLGLDQPIPVQYVKFLGEAVQGNFGSYFCHRRGDRAWCVHRDPPRWVCCEFHHVHIADRGVLADVPDRDFADLPVFG